MKYSSTGKNSPIIHFEDAIFVGVAPDGGLYVPDTIPVFTKKEIDSLPSMSMHQIAVLTLHKWLSDTFSKSEIEEIVESSLTFSMPLLEVGSYKVLELFHGPTYSFTDISSRFVASIFKKILAKRKIKGRVMLASSGDSGSAIAHSFGSKNDSETVVVYPKGQLSDIQQAQITRIGEKVLAIEVDGTFEDCRKMVNDAFEDPDMKGHNYLSASSMSIARIIPQIVIYAYLYSQMAPLRPSVVIPSGNFGNACTALLAKLMGIPIGKIVIACNKNDAAVEYAKTGKYTPKQTVKTLSNAMDIGDPHNFPRILHFCGYSHKKFLEFFEAYTIADSKVINTINAIWSEYEYIIEPHTAVAWAAADEMDSDPRATVIVATASPMKYAEMIHKHTGIEVDNKDVLSELHKREAKFISINNDYEDFKNILIREFDTNN